MRGTERSKFAAIADIDIGLSPLQLVLRVFAVDAETANRFVDELVEPRQGKRGRCLELL